MTQSSGLGCCQLKSNGDPLPLEHFLLLILPCLHLKHLTDGAPNLTSCRAPPLPLMMENTVLIFDLWINKEL